VQQRAGRSWRRALIVAGLVMVADQVTKSIVRGSLLPGERRTVLSGILDLTNTRNKGVAFGALAGGGAVVAALIGLALGALVVYFVLRADTPHLWLPVGLLLGGALGNLADRARMGSVTDFIDPRLWPAFNVADSCVVCGVLILLWVIEGSADSPDG
jgi:signal peptidase II